ncbi:MAG: peptidase M28, partial [Bacteroidota bacterium]
MKKALFLLLAIGLMPLTNVKGQTAAEIFAETIPPNDLEAHLYFLADDLLEGRATTKRGQKLA